MKGFSAHYVDVYVEGCLNVGDGGVGNDHRAADGIEEDEGDSSGGVLLVVTHQFDEGVGVVTFDGEPLEEGGEDAVLVLMDQQ